MSIISSGRKSGISFTSSKQKVVRFQLAYNLKSLLSESLNGKGQQVYEELVCTIRDAGQEIKDYDLLQLLKEARGCISILDENVRLFVQVLLIIKWTHRSEELVQEYQGFLLDLCSAQSYYTKFTLEQLVLNFKGSDVEHAEWVSGKPSVEEEICFTRIHGVIKVLLLVVPMSQELLITIVTNNFPYIKRSTQEHVSYIYNILRILQYKPDLRLTFLNFIINKLLAIDVQAPKSEIEEKEKETNIDEDTTEVFTMDIETKEELVKPKSMKHPIANMLDQCMVLMFNFIHSQCYDGGGQLIWNRTKSFYSEMTQIFENIILPTHASHHVQFLLLYLLSLNNNLSYSFIQFIWRKVVNPNVPPIIRQAGVSYIASLLARAKYMPIKVLKETLADLTSWIHGYISNQDGLEIKTDCRIHGVFYSVCQALFYVIAFRHKDLVNQNKDLIFLQGLNLAKVVTCRLNPLRVCLPAVTSHFASVTRHYQLAYCYSIIEHNSRNTIPLVYRDSTGAATTSCTQIYLDTYFPFDPYLLYRSNDFIKSLYREYDGSIPEDSYENKLEGTETTKEDEDDFLMEQTSATNSLSNFSYGTSPGFLQM